MSVRPSNTYTNTYTVAILKGFLRTSGLQTTGSKAELIARLDALGPAIWIAVEQEFEATRESATEIREEEDFEDGVVELLEILRVEGRTTDDSKIAPPCEERSNYYAVNVMFWRDNFGSKEKKGSCAEAHPQTLVI